MDLGEAGRSWEDDYPLLGNEAGFESEDPGLLARAQGCLLGQLAGDSLGALVEFLGPAEIERRYPGGGPRQLEDGGTWNLLAGQPTDDSELALMLARALVKEGRYGSSAVATAYARWMDSSPFDCGGTIGTALRAASQALGIGADAAKAAVHAASRDSQANGALMRISPLGILGHALPPARVASLAREDARLTHPHAVCQDASALFAVTVAHAVRTGDDARSVHAFAREWAEEAALTAEIRESLEAAQAGPPADYLTHAGWVLVALQNAFHQLLTNETLEAGVRRSVAAGGDTDTNAAIAGALLGAVYGVEGIPGQWRDAILTCRPAEGMPVVFHPRPRPFWPVDALQLAGRLVVVGRRLAEPA